MDTDGFMGLHFSATGKMLLFYSKVGSPSPHCHVATQFVMFPQNLFHTACHIVSVHANGFDVSTTLIVLSSIYTHLSG